MDHKTASINSKLALNLESQFELSRSQNNELQRAICGTNLRFQYLDSFSIWSMKSPPQTAYSAVYTLKPKFLFGIDHNLRLAEMWL